MGYDLELAPDRFVYSHARALSSHPEFKLVGAVDQGFRDRETFKQVYKLPAYETLEQAIANETVDLVVLATPTTTHYELLRELLNISSPKAVLCEKPLSYSIEESRQMLELCALKGVALYVNYMRRSEPGAVEVKCRIKNSEIAGKVKGIVWYSKGFLHNGSHFFNLIEDWLGEMRSFTLIDAGRSLPNGDAEPDIRVMFEKGEVLFMAAKDENFSLNAIELVADNGRLRYENGGRHIQWTPIERDKELRGYAFLASASEELPSKLNRYQHFVVDQLVEAFRGKTAYLCDGRQALQTLESMQSILKVRV
jgi:predicted dehydrogenase